MSTDLSNSPPPADTAAASAQVDSSAVNFIDSILNKDDGPPAVESSPAPSQPAAPRHDVNDSPLRNANAGFEGGQQPQAPAPQPQNTPRVAGIPDDLVATAQDLGIDPSALGAYRSNPDALRSYLNSVTQSVIASVAPRYPAQMQQAPGVPFGFMQQPQMPQMPMQQPPQGAGFPQGGMPHGSQQPPLNRPAGQQGPWNESFKREDYEEGLAKAIEDMWQQNQHLSATVQQMQQFHMQQHQQQMMQMAVEQQRHQAIMESEQFDSLIGSLPPAAQALFGKGSFREINPSSPLFANRSRVFDAYRVTREAYQSRGLNPRPEWLLDQAAQAVLGEHWQFIQQSSRQNPQTISRPGRVGYSTEQGNTSEDEAANFIGQFMADKGEQVPRSRQRESLGLLS